MNGWSVRVQQETVHGESEAVGTRIGTWVVAALRKLGHRPAQPARRLELSVRGFRQDSRAGFQPLGTTGASFHGPARRHRDPRDGQRHASASTVFTVCSTRSRSRVERVPQRVTRRSFEMVRIRCQICPRQTSERLTYRRWLGFAQRARIQRQSPRVRRRRWR